MFRFNSNLVQLKGRRSIEHISPFLCFNSNLVQLKVPRKNVSRLLSASFQFQFGSIKRSPFGQFDRRRAGFNSNLVQLKDRIRSKILINPAQVSIPIWFN